MAKTKAAESKEAQTNGEVDLSTIEGSESISATHNFKDDEGKPTGESKTVSVEIPVPQTTEEAVAVYGEDVVHDLFWRAYKVKAQARIRALIEQGKTEDEISTEMQNYRPDVTRRASKDPVAEARKQVTKMSAEQRAEFLALLQDAE